MSVNFAKGVLEKETSKVRHLILLSDGDDAEAQEGCDAVVDAMRREHITTSTVAIGRGKDLGFLKNLAAVGGGRYYLADMASKLPAILTQDTSVMSRSAIEEGAFYPKIVGDDQVLNGIDSTPPLLAYCISSARPLADTSMVTKKDDPLLARWNYGLGSSLAFTSDAKPKWASKWTSWSGFSAFWSQAIRSIARQRGLNAYQVSLDQSTGSAKVKIVAQDEAGNPVGKLTGKVSLVRPDGSGGDVEVSEQAPGVFTGSFDSTELGTYILTVSESGADGSRRINSSGFSVQRSLPARTSNLQTKRTPPQGDRRHHRRPNPHRVGRGAAPYRQGRHVDFRRLEPVPNAGRRSPPHRHRRPPPSPALHPNLGRNPGPLRSAQARRD
jgi:hypothetical protein